MRIGPHEIGSACPTFVTAEIGLNHSGSVETAKRLIDVAVDAGCQAVKFQKRTVEVVYTPEELAQPRESPFGTTNGDLKRALEFGFREYAQIDDYCREKGILWFASPWDTASVEFLEQFDPPAHKVASAMVTNTELLRAVAATGRPIIISTGMTGMTALSRALAPHTMAFDRMALLACTSTYPAAVTDLHLGRIGTLRRYFDMPVGYSGHEVGLWTTLCAAAMGACIVERHVTLSRAMWGSDQAASVEPQGLKKLVDEIRTFEKARGSGELRMLDVEIPVAKKLRWHER